VAKESTVQWIKVVSWFIYCTGSINDTRELDIFRKGFRHLNQLFFQHSQAFGVVQASFGESLLLSQISQRGQPDSVGKVLYQNKSIKKHSSLSSSSTSAVFDQTRACTTGSCPKQDLNRLIFLGSGTFRDKRRSRKRVRCELAPCLETRATSGHVESPKKTAEKDFFVP